MELARLAPYDLHLYKSCKDIYSRVTSLLKLWKDAKLPILKREVKKNVVTLINTKFQGVEKHCVFLGEFSVPYTLARIKKEVQNVMHSILIKYNIESPLKEKNKEEELIFYFLLDDLDIYWNQKRINERY